MKPLSNSAVNDYVNRNIVTFHDNRLSSLKKLKLHDILKRKNPYLFKAKNISTGADLVQGFLEAHLSSSEEKVFGDFLEKFAIFIAGRTCGGKKSSTTGIDLEFENERTDSSINLVIAIRPPAKSILTESPS